MNLMYFHSYLEVLKRGSFSEAAKALGLSQPTVSFHVQRLEAELGTKLLDRQGGRIMVTPAGREFHGFAEKVLREHALLVERLAYLHEEIVGTLSLGASTNPGEQIVPKLLGDFQRLHSKVLAKVIIADTAEIVDKVLARECDAGFVGAEIKRRGLNIQKIAEDQLLLIAAPGHPLLLRSSVEPQDLEAEHFVAREEGSGTQRTVEELLSGHGVDPHKLAPKLVAGSNQAVVTAVEAGIGIAFVSRKAAARSLELGRVKAVPFTGTDWVRGIYFVYPTHASTTRLFQEFVRFTERWKES